VVTIACYETIDVALGEDERETLRLSDVLFIGAPSAWKVARQDVRPEAWVVVPGATTGAAVGVDHSRIVEGWGPHLRTRLDELSLA
jgi:hypothetical protein